MRHGFWSDRAGRRLAACGCLLAATALLLPPQLFSQTGGAAKSRKTTKTTKAPEKAVGQNPFPNRVPAPELDGGKEWLNTSGEITLKDLRGKVVLIDFWTFCCINCMHVLPDLAFLEKKYDKQLVVIGVHSAKFENEKDSENIRRAIVRYEIVHPVINDANMTIWQKFGVRSWPTLVLIDPEGNYCGHVAGEGQRDLLDQVIQKVVTYHRNKGTLDETPVRFDLERNKLAAGPLKFPGKVLADAAGKRLFISDSNHNRIVVASLDGQLLDVIGTGAIGKHNGTYAEATFDHPQGIELVGDTLYVADTENHMLRAVDLTKKTVRTIAGTGQQARGRDSGGPALKTLLSSPWDVRFVNDRLYIAMAGPHQIWYYDPESHSVSQYAGSGREDIINGPLDDAALAQPSGIATDGKFLYVVDSEGSAVRQIPVNSRGEVTTIVGTSDLPQGRCLFEFGDRDGKGDEVRLQHPLGIVYHDGQLFVADSYNHKIKQIDIQKQTATTFLGIGGAGDKLSPPQFSEPAGVSIAEGKLYIADTNNHRICVADLASKEVSVLTIAGLTPPAPAKVEESDGAEESPAPPQKAQIVAAGKALPVEIALWIPEDYKLNAEYPASWKLKVAGEQPVVPADAIGPRQELEIKDKAAGFSLPLTGKTGKATLQVSVTYGYCRETSEGKAGLCKIKTARWSIPLEVAAAGKETKLTLTVPAEEKKGEE